MVANGKLYTTIMEKLNFEPRLDAIVKAVEQFLLAQGINKNRLATGTYDKGMPELDADNENAWTLNYRE